jgi:hypothetical protein
LPHTSTGAVIGAVTWLPLSTEPVPDVRGAPSAPEPVTDAPPWQAAVDTPSRAAAFPHTLIGMVIGIDTWFPEATEPVPEVVGPVEANAAVGRAVAAAAMPADSRMVFAVRRVHEVMGVHSLDA